MRRTIILCLLTLVRAHEVCIIGAGPAGIQLGHLLHGAGRDYRIFERNADVATFFERYPVHRRLISLNQVHTGVDDPEFRMRHDWNSLLENDEVAPMTERTHDKWPHADEVVRYLRDFASVSRNAGRIAFNTTVRAVERAESNTFTLHVHDHQRVQCDDVVVATGVGVPRTLEVGESLVFGYEDLPPVEHFDGHHVAVLGNGNAAFETVEGLGNHAYVTLIHRARPLDWPARCNSDDAAHGTRMSMMTHYVGDVRAGRLSIFDAYNLKMRDRVLRIAPEDTPIVFPCMGENKTCVSTSATEHVHFEFEAHHLAAVERAVDAYDARSNPTLGPNAVEINTGGRFDPDNCELHPDHPDHEGFRSVDATVFDARWRESVELIIEMDALLADPHLLSFFANQLADIVPNPLLEPDPEELLVVDSVIRCFGWHYDDTILDSTIRPASVYGGKYPQIDGLYRSQSGIFFAGAVAHAPDFRVSAGGFIHGFRYTARALFRYLEVSRHQVPWPSRTYVSEDKMLPHMLYRFNHAAGPYQMLGGTLVDAVVLECVDGALSTSYLEEVPPTFLHAHYLNATRITWFFEYGAASHGPHQLHADNVGATEEWRAHESTFLHPRLQRFAPGRADVHAEHWMLEDLSFRFDRHARHIAPLRAFLDQGYHETVGDCEL